MEGRLVQYRAGQVDRQPGAVIAWEERVGFPVRVVGHCDVPVFPQLVENWWLEPLSSDTSLPERAQRRLEAVLATGIRLKDVVVFHEIPRTEEHSGTTVIMQEVPARRDPQPGSARVLMRWLKEAAQRQVPLVKRTAHRAAAAIRRTQERQANRPKRRDPCLVVVTEDGDWLEIDRWYT